MNVGVDVELEKDLEPMVDILTQLLLRHTIQNHPVIGNVVRYMSMFGPRSKFYDGEGAIPDDEMERIRKEFDIGYWHARFALYGDEEEMDHNYRKIQKAFAHLPGVKVIGKKFLPREGERFVNNEDIPLSEGGGPQVGCPTLVPLRLFEGMIVGILDSVLFFLLLERRLWTFISLRRNSLQLMDLIFMLDYIYILVI
jgi:hypothetical protein